MNGGVEWRPVVGYEGCYEVSNLGEVRSITRTVQRANQTQTWQSRILKPTLGRAGYYTVHLHKDAFRKTAAIHRLVAEAFIDNPRCKPCVNHIDGNKHNNRADNLEWVTYTENLDHAYKTSLRTKRPDSKPYIQKRCKTVPTKTELIQALYVTDCNMTRVGEIYNVTGTSVRKWCDKYGIPHYKSEMKHYIKWKGKLE